MNWYKLAKKAKHHYSWTYINLPTKIQNQLISFGKQIDPDDLYIKEAEDGLEKEPHITVKYALLTNEIKDIREILEKEKKGKFYLGESTVFECDKYDVIKIEVESKDLRRIHEKLNNLPHEDKYPEYKAHATIAYLKKGKGKKYIGKFKINKSMNFNELFFENIKNKNYKIKLANTFNLSQRRIPKKNKGGNCYEVAAKYVLDSVFKGKQNKDIENDKSPIENKENIFLVHGEVTGQKDISGIKYGHAWVEEGDMVLDMSNNRNIHLPKAVYYALGNITKTIRHSPEETRNKILEYGHWGPWELQTEL